MKSNEDYKTLIEEILEKLEKAKKSDEDYLLENAEIERILSYIEETKEKVNIQIQNNVILRKMFKSEQDSNKEHTKKIAKLEKEINALKNNIREAYNKLD